MRGKKSHLTSKQCRFLQRYTQEWKEIKVHTHYTDTHMHAQLTTQDVFYRGKKMHCCRHSITTQQWGHNFTTLLLESQLCTEMVPIFIKTNSLKGHCYTYSITVNVTTTFTVAELKIHIMWHLLQVILGLRMKLQEQLHEYTY